MRLLTKNGSPTLRRPSADVRKRVSALYDDDADKKVDRKTSSKGNIFTNFKSGVRAVFQSRKASFTCKFRKDRKCFIFSYDCFILISRSYL